MEALVHGGAVFLRRKEGRPDLPALWCLHGYGASGESFLESFQAPVLAPYSIYVPDFPGFGESPAGPKPPDFQQTADLLADLIHVYTPTQPVALVAHSAGGLVGTRLARSLPRLLCFVNVEGNLTEADNFISGRAAAATDIDAWRREFVEKVRGQAATDEALRRYCRDLLRAAPAALRRWARCTLEDTGTTHAGESFRKLDCPKLYIYGGRSIPAATLDFLRARDIPRMEFAESGHSPMIDEAGRFYAAVDKFLQGLLAKSRSVEDPGRGLD